MNRSGMSLVEVVVALTVFSVGMLAAVATSAVVTQATTASWNVTRMNSVGRSRVEKLKSNTCTSLEGSTYTTGPFSEKVTQTNQTDAKLITDSVTYRYGRTSKTKVFSEVVWCKAL